MARTEVLLLAVAAMCLTALFLALTPGPGPHPAAPDRGQSTITDDAQADDTPAPTFAPGTQSGQPPSGRRPAMSPVAQPPQPEPIRAIKEGVVRVAESAVARARVGRALSPAWRVAADTGTDPTARSVDIAPGRTPG